MSNQTTTKSIEMNNGKFITIRRFKHYTDAPKAVLELPDRIYYEEIDEFLEALETAVNELNRWMNRSETAVCEYTNCDKPAKCFHYCQEHHEAICLRIAVDFGESDQ